MYKNLLFVWVLAVSALFCSSSSFACDDDSDCKGDRICNRNGKCVSPDEDDSKVMPRAAHPNFVPQQQQRIASVCQTNYGRCAMSVAIPVGSSCYCPTQVGPIAGVAM